MLVEFAYPHQEEALSATNKALAERARKALVSINASFAVPKWKSKYILGGCFWVDQANVVLDFKGYRPGEIGQAFTGPIITLCDDVFEGDSLKTSFVKEILDGFADFERHMNSDD